MDLVSPAEQLPFGVLEDFAPPEDRHTAAEGDCFLTA